MKKIAEKWDSTEELLSTFVSQHRGQDGIPKTSYNWHSDNSDIAFIWRYNFMALHRHWTVTQGDRALPWLLDGIEWVLSMADENLPKNAAVNATVEWPNIQKRVSLPQTGYARSPHEDMGPGWSRLINIGRIPKDGPYADRVIHWLPNGDAMAFRPEILVSGATGYALARFCQDAKASGIESDTIDKCIEHLVRLFKWHEPNWRDDHTHPDGDLFGEPHSGLKISAYTWPKGIGEEADGNIPGTNQQVQFLMMGLITEELAGKDIGALSKVKALIKNTLPHLVKVDNNRMCTAYDFRAHSKMSKHGAEPTNDGTHWEKTAPIFLEGVKRGLLPVEMQDQLINQILDITHLGNGKMGILQDGSTDHDGGNYQKNPSFAHIAGALFFENGYRLIQGGVAEAALALDMPNPYGHKSSYYHATLRAAQAFHADKLDPGSCRAAPALQQQPAARPAAVSDVPATETAEKPVKAKGKSKSKTIITPPLNMAELTAIPESIGSEGLRVESLGENNGLLRNPNNWDSNDNVSALLLEPTGKKGKTVVTWYAGDQCYTTEVTVA